jgi:3-deoxy-D-manno-octulosonic-acid transferase
LSASGLVLARRSGWADIPPASAAEADVWLGDSLGEMAMYASTADVALLGAVMREGEEAMLLAEWAEWSKSRPAANRPLLLIVPRHPQRFDEVAALVQGAGFTLARRSGWGDVPPAEALRADVWLGDSMREMALYYAVADVALLGGSFAPLGGQNLIEAAACGCPIVMGPHTFNFAQAAELSQAAGAALRVADMAAGVDTACALLDSPEREQRAAQARAFAAAHRGAARRMTDYLLRWLPMTAVS